MFVVALCGFLCMSSTSKWKLGANLSESNLYISVPCVHFSKARYPSIIDADPTTCTYYVYSRLFTAVEITVNRAETNDQRAQVDR